MEPRDIEEAYEPFAAALREGQFREVAEGWNADQIAAHIALNNDAIAATARDVLGSGTASYDNEAAVADETLASYAGTFADRTELAADVRRSAAGLAAAYAALVAAGAPGEVQIPTVIRHNGQIIRDDLGPVTDLVEGNATFHLAMHFQQLTDLEE